MPKFLAGPVDLDTTNVGAGFVGHDISSIFKAVKDSVSAKENGVRDYRCQRGAAITVCD